jgi:anti-anti-sigma factor
MVAALAGNPTIILDTDIDMASVDLIRSMLQPSVEAGGPVVIDMSNVPFMDSTGAHLLIELADELGDRGCVIVHGANSGVSKVMEITQLASVCPNIHLIGCSVLSA